MPSLSYQAYPKVVIPDLIGNLGIESTKIQRINYPNPKVQRMQL